MLEKALENIRVLCHSSIKFEKEKIIYFDPFKVDKNYNDADIIFITHSHYDHFSEEDILKVKKETTKIVMPEETYMSNKEKLNNVLSFKEENIIIVEPNKSYTLDNINFKTITAYNVNKNFHPKENNWVGYIIYLDDISYYIAGDTDITEENKQVKCDVAFVPIGGTYTMTAKEAAELINTIKPKIAVPTHYGLIVGTKEDEETFKRLIGDVSFANF